MTHFAQETDIANGWRPLTAAEKVDAVSKIAAVSHWIQDRKPDLGADNSNAKFVVVEVVRQALKNAKHAGHSSYSRTVGGVTTSGTLIDPGGSLVITDFHRELLRIPKTAAPSWNFGDERG